MENRWKGLSDDMFNNQGNQGYNEVKIPIKDDEEISIVTLHLGSHEQPVVLNVAVNEKDLPKFTKVIGYNRIPYTVQPIDMA
jgi:hypothetical protein